MSGGAEPFSAFMARAVTAYYGRNIRTVGSRGDFSTTATLSPLLGRAVSRWLAEEARAMPQVHHIIEAGPGDGSLMATVRRSLGWWQRRRFAFHLVETSPVLRARQQEKLGAVATWHDTLESALQAADGAAFIYHNELLDAFPVTLLEWRQGQWWEVYVHEGREELREPPPFERDQFSVLGDWEPKEGQRCELHDSVRRWLALWTPHWNRGAMLTVDYGDLFPALYHRRPAGTLRAYLLQQRLEGPAIYQNPGRQDITADINFTDYRHWLRARGAEETAYGTQAELLRGGAGTAADAFVQDPHGAGTAFKYVTHRRLRR